MVDQIKSTVLEPFDDKGLLTLPDVFDRSVEKYGSSVMMKKRHPWGYQSISYGEFGRLVSFLGAGLLTRGLARGDRVALMAANSPEWMVVYAAVTASGAVIVPLDTALTGNELKHILLHSEARFLVVSPEIHADLIEGKEMPGTDIIVLGERDSNISAATVTEIMAAGKERIAAGDDCFLRARFAVRPEDIATIAYTSGTTGQPKAAVLLHSNLVSDLVSIKNRLPITAADTFLCLLPLHHTFSSMCVFLAPLTSGSAIAFARSIKPKQVLEDIVREGVTILVGVPLFFEHFAPMLAPVRESETKVPGLMKRIYLSVARKFDRIFGVKTAPALPERKVVTAGLEKINYCISGAASLRPDVENAFFSAGLPLLQGYGLTEASPVVAVNPFDRPRKGTIGPALPGVQVRIEDPDADGAGEIIVKGPNVMREYYRNPEATRAALVKGWLHTGDLGKIDEKGYISIVGRKKSVIVTAGGKNIYPDEMEAALNRNIYILECVVMAVEDRRGNTRPGAVIVPNYDMLSTVDELKGNTTEETIRKFIGEQIKLFSQNLPDYKKLYDYQIRNEELPKTSTRKVKRHLVTWIRQ